MKPGAAATDDARMVSVLFAGRIAPHRPVLRSAGDFQVFRAGAGRWRVSAPGADLAPGRVIAVVSCEKGTIAHFTGHGSRGEIHTVSAGDGTYVDEPVEFVFYAVA